MEIKDTQPKERILYLPTQVTQTSMNDLNKAILEINAHDAKLEKLYPILLDMEYERKPIKIYIDSYGGYVYQCFGLLGVMKTSKTPIHTIATGAAMSCGFMILVSGHKRYGYELCTPMYHQVSSWHFGTTQDLKESMEETERLQAIIEEITLEKTKIKKDKLKEIREKKIDWFMTAKEALKLGVIDKIIE